MVLVYELWDWNIWWWVIVSNVVTVIGLPIFWRLFQGNGPEGLKNRQSGVFVNLIITGVTGVILLWIFWPVTVPMWIAAWIIWKFAGRLATE